MTAIDPVLLAAPPRIDPARAVDVARTAFGIDAVAVRDLGSERDRAFLLLDAAGAGLAVVKVSNTAEDPATLDMEAEAVVHAARVDPGLPLAVPRATSDGARRVAIESDEGIHHVRAYDVLPGRGRSDPRDLPDAAFVGWGETTARIGRALRGFMHPAAVRSMLWDVQHASRTRDFLPTIGDPEQRAIVERTLDRFETVIAPVWPSLRAQVIHADLTTDNTLVDVDGRITGIVDFGDMSHSALITDIASALDSIVSDRPPRDLPRLMRLYLDGYERITPLEDEELRLTGDLLAARAAITIAISCWRAGQGLEDPAFAGRYNAAVARTIVALEAIGYEAIARRMSGSPAAAGAGRRQGGTAELIHRRDAALGPALEPLSYATPLHLERGEGTWLIDTAGRRYLDAYNNVPSVGHGHPRVTSAIARAARRLNTNLRYLHDDAVELAERLIATLPDGLDTVLFVNSGSEANDLAWRLATTATGARGGLCTAFAYHGISEAIAPLSPESWPGGRQPDHVETWATPDALRGTALDGEPFADALARLRGRGIEPAAIILDGALTSDGYPVPDPALVRGWAEAARAAGALWIADEVQGGHGRTGAGLWSFERFGIVPDLVTLGKPMGNGHPVGAVVTRRDLVRHFAEETVFFSTFGGNPVAAAASLAVLDVLDDERLVARAADIGERLRAAIRATAAGDARIADVRGIGQATGVEVVRPDGSLAPDRATTAAIREGLRDRGVLVGTAGAAGNVLKIRPPLVFGPAEVDVFARAFGEVLSDAPTAPSR
ncbi:MAG: aminotransferase class III-fold pyridoxal phosphate-dependent enzyme [Candidatus Limnocylindria bacterium]